MYERALRGIVGMIKTLEEIAADPRALDRDRLGAARILLEIQMTIGEPSGGEAK